MAARWHHERSKSFIPQGKDSSQFNFSREERSALSILIREALQNALDARSPGSKAPVRVVIRNLGAGQFDADYLSRIFCADFRSRLEAATSVALPPATDARVKVLVIEDFGTIGLQGRFDDPDADEPGENWNAFWHREGQGAKSRGSLGGAGQGKITFFRQSEARSVFGLTVRESDGKRLMMGRANFLSDYRFNGHRYVRYVYYTTDDTKPLPETTPNMLDDFSRAVGVQRQAGQSGLSLVIPYAPDFSAEEAIKYVILEFYAPIIAGRLTVQIDTVELRADTVDAIAAQHVTDTDARDRSSCFTQAYRSFVKEIVTDGADPVVLAEGWEKDTVIKPECFPADAIPTLHKKLLDGARVRIQLPLKVKKAGGPDEATSFDVFLQIPEDLKRTEEAFLRSDLVIGGEQPLSNAALVQKARSLTRITDQTLSEFLLAAEEPSHLKWNESLLRDKGGYREYRNTLRAVRQAATRLLIAILGAQTTRDTRALAKFFTRPAQEGRRTQDGGGPGPQNPPPPPPPPPPPKPKHFRYETSGTKARYLPVPATPFSTADLPVRALVEFAYEVDGNPFHAYDPFDFDLADPTTYPVTARGLTIVSRKGNKLEIEVTDSDFELEVDGFSPNLILLSRLSYDLPGQAAGEKEEEQEAEESDA